MKSIFFPISIIIITLFAAGCSKVENDFTFDPIPYKKPPPPPPPPPPDPKDRYVKTDPYKYDSNFLYTYESEFVDIIESKDEKAAMTASPFEGQMVLAFPHYEIVLPLDPATGLLKTGKYTVSKNVPGALAPVRMNLNGYKFPEDATSDFVFNCSIEITGFNKDAHTVSGNIEFAGWRQLLFDDLYQGDKIKNGTFTVPYNYCDITVNGEQITTPATHLSTFSQQLYFGGLEGIKAEYPGGKKLLGNDRSGYTSFWTEDLLGRYIADKGVGVFQKDYLYVKIDSAKNLPPFSFAINDQSRIFPSDLLTLTIDKFNTDQYIRGSLKFKGKTISNWADENNLRFDAGSPNYEVKVDFRFMKHNP